MKIIIGFCEGRISTVDVDDETIVNKVGFVEEKPIDQETCKWKKPGNTFCKIETIENPHVSMSYITIDRLTDEPYCSHCGKKIEVIE